MQLDSSDIFAAIWFSQRMEIFTQKKHDKCQNISLSKDRYIDKRKQT